MSETEAGLGPWREEEKGTVGRCLKCWTAFKLESADRRFHYSVTGGPPPQWVNICLNCRLRKL